MRNMKNIDMTMELARRLLLHMKLKRQTFCMYAGRLFTLDYVLGVLKGRKVEADEAMEAIA